MYNFDDNVVRVLEINLRNYKNISNGTIKMSNIFNVENSLGDVLGIYGQNGSGKLLLLVLWE